MQNSGDTPAERYRWVADRLTDRVGEMSPDAWDRPTPCEGWVGRDIVRHLVEWVPAVLGPAGLPAADIPSVDDDPAAAWHALDTWLRGALDDPDAAGRTFDAGPPGQMTVATAIDQLVTGDVLIHTWDLARTGGLDESLDPTIVSEVLAGLQPIDDVLRASGHFGPKVEVPDDADDQAKLIAFTGRRP
jgi:uncharacterized protein (TIGR03086 family)